MRSAEFDREKVLSGAINAFIAKGYNKTSMQDLKVATGLHPGSIYGAFKSKKGLMLAAIKQYETDKNQTFKTFFAGKTRLTDGILEYLLDTVKDIRSTKPDVQKACLIQKALTELNDNEPEIEAALRQSLSGWQGAFTDIFQQARENGEIDDARTLEQRTQSLVIGIFGLRTYAQIQTDIDVLNQQAEQIFRDVCA